MDIIFRAAYGSSKDIAVYKELDMKVDQIYIVGKISKKLQSFAIVRNTTNEYSPIVIVVSLFRLWMKAMSPTWRNFREMAPADRHRVVRE